MKNALQQITGCRNLSRSLSLLFVMFFLNFTLVAQSTVRGRVVSDDGEGLPGVTVLVQGTSNGTTTDVDGNYSLSAASDATLEFSYIGFTTQIIPINGRTQIDINMALDVSELDEVVVIGYGTRKKSHSTGAIAQVSGKDVAAIQANRVDDALGGKLAGVLIQNADGEPGADPKIQIRAASSVSGNSDPLIVVDGYPISGSLATINPNDIESLEVLKDAASAAIYGSRGANGVILVTTKKGKSGKAVFSYNGYTSISNRYVKDLDQLKTGAEWAGIVEAGIANGTYDVSEVDETFLNYRLDAYKESPDVVAVEDWLFRTGKSTSHDFSVSGGTNDVNYFASLGYLNTEGVVITQGFERYNGRLNLDANLSDKFKAGLNINGYYGNRDIVGWDMRDLLRAYSVHPVYHTEASIAFVQALDAEAQSLGLDPFDDGYRGASRNAPFNSSIYTLEPGMYAHDWHYGRANNGIGGSGDAGPAAKLDNTKQFQKTYFANVSSYLQYNIMEGLNVKTVLGADIRDTQDFYYRGLESDSQGRLEQTNLDQTDTKFSTVLSESTLSYAKTFGSHDLSAVAGFEFQNTKINASSLDGTNVPFGQIINYNLLDPADIAVSERHETRTRRSVFGRINYAYDDRYLASVSLRRDGDSRFGANNRFETFPAVSLGWNVHNESFYNLDFLSNLKLRFSTGSLGTTSFLGSYNSLSLLNAQTTVLGNGYLIPSNVANPDLTWQTNTETNFGANFGFMSNRITLGVDYYTSDTEDMLIRQSVSEVLGTTSIVLNRGDVTSSGLEIELGLAVLDKKDLIWDMSANLSTVSTEITSLGDLTQLPDVIYGQSGRGPVFRNYVGGEIGEMWTLETIGEVEGVHIADPSRTIGMNSAYQYVKDQQSPGEPGYGEIDRTRTVAEGGDLVKAGQNTPDFYWGMTHSLRYKEFDVSLSFQGAQGGEVFNIDPIYWKSQFGGRLRTSFDADTDDIADHNQQHYTQTRYTNAVIQDASYLALRNLTIGYKIRPEWVSKAGISSARIYAAATNLLYLMGNDYTSMNPEGIHDDSTLGPTTSGVQVGESPIVRSFTLGVNINF